MDLTFEKATLTVRALEMFHGQKRSQFDKLTRHAARPTQDIAMSKMTPQKIATRLAEYRKDIDDSAALISELRQEIVNLSEGSRARPVREVRE